MNATDTNRNPRGTGIATPARVLRRARGAAVLTQPRLQLAFDQSTGAYSLAML